MDVFLDRSRSMPNIRRMTTVLTDNVHEAVSSVALTGRSAAQETRQGCIEFVPIVRDAASSGVESVQTFASTVYERGRSVDIKEGFYKIQQFFLWIIFAIFEYIRSFWHGQPNQSSSS